MSGFHAELVVEMEQASIELRITDPVITPSL